VQFFSRLGKAQQSGNGVEDLETAITHRLNIPRKTGDDYMIFLCISTDEINLFDGKHTSSLTYQADNPVKNKDGNYSHDNYSLGS
jgi:hypothetical protein